MHTMLPRLGAVLFTGLFAFACSDDDGKSNDNTGGASSTGGKSSGSGGASSTGGKSSGDGGGGSTSTPDGGTPDDDGGTPTGDRLYGVNSIVTSGDDTTSYLAYLDTLGSQTVDYDSAREFSGLADIAVHEGFVYVADGEKATITKYAIEGKELVSKGEVSLASYGISDIGFWLNAFVAKDKAYFVNGVAEYIVWNPDTMEITGTFDIPGLEDRDGLKAAPSYMDRSVVVRDGKMYHPIYWTDKDFVSYTADSAVIVVDIATDKVTDTLTLPCPGIDHATTDADGNVFYSPWIFAPGGAGVLTAPSTCVAKMAKDESIERSFYFKDVFDGKEGGVFRIVGDGKAIVSVLDVSHAAAADRDDFATVTYGANWRFWSYDLATKETALVDAIDWNAGAAYSNDVDGKSYSLVPAGDYASTTVWDVTDPTNAKSLFDTKGWSLRLLRLK